LSFLLESRILRNVVYLIIYIIKIALIWILCIFSRMINSFSPRTNNLLINSAANSKIVILSYDVITEVFDLFYCPITNVYLAELVNIAENVILTTFLKKVYIFLVHSKKQHKITSCTVMLMLTI
jgi:hypothetical protein